MKALITADLHLRKNRPRCRLDEDWLGTQKKVLKEILDIFNKTKSDELFIVGDIFHSPVQLPEIVNIFLDTFDIYNEECSPISILAGNHDIQYHDYNNVDRSSYGILKRRFHEISEYNEPSEFKKKIEIRGYDYGKEVTEQGDVLFLHTLTFPDEKSKPKMADGITAEELLNRYPKPKWIFTGDYHKHFHFEKDGRHVINPGCILRQAADFIDYKPVVYFVDTEEEIVKPIFLTDDEEMVTDEYIKKEKERNDRIESFVSTIKGQKNVTLDFTENLESKMDNISKEIKDILLEILEELRT